MNAREYFSTTVVMADQKFRDACVALDIESCAFTHPLPGPHGEALTLRACTLGPTDARKRLFVISGMHGIEGYAGAAIQTGWLCKKGVASLPADTAIVMAHMINPWGMAWDRRETEDNIDLFRNLLYCEDPSTPDPLFDLVDDTLDLENWSEQRSESWSQRVTELVEVHGKDRLIAAIRRGQHHRPKSMTYHGTGPCWSYHRVHEIVDTYLAGARQIAVLDIHTGFGDYGAGLVMSYDPPGSEKHTRLSNWFNDAIYTPGGDADIPDHTTQLPFEWIESLVAGAEVTAEILEFGTSDPAEIGEIFNANHHFHLYADPRSEEGLKWGKRYRRYSYPEQEDWMNAVWVRGREVIELTLQGLSDWRTE